MKITGKWGLCCLLLVGLPAKGETMSEVCRRFMILVQNSMSQPMSNTQRAFVTASNLRVYLAEQTGFSKVTHQVTTRYPPDIHKLVGRELVGVVQEGDGVPQVIWGEVESIAYRGEALGQVAVIKNTDGKGSAERRDLPLRIGQTLSLYIKDVVK